MRRLVKYKEINNNTTYLEKQIIELEAYKNKLCSDIQLIDNDYKGKDAENIIAKYTAELQLLEEYITNVKAYNSFFRNMSGRYEETHEKAARDINYEKDLLDVESKKIAEEFGNSIIYEGEKTDEKWYIYRACWVKWNFRYNK